MIKDEATKIPALFGGPPVRHKLLPYGRQEINEADVEAVVAVLRSDWLTTGPKVAEFEAAVASAVGARFAVAVSSGTGALHGAAFAAQLKAGDEAITSPMTFAASANCVLYQGARPVFADVEPDTLNLDPQQASAKLTPRTRALIPVDYSGHPAQMDAFLDLARKHNLIVIEDACHALGATYRGRNVGSLAHMTVFSFHPVKHVTTAEGGMVTTNDAELARRLRMFRNHGITTDARERSGAGQYFYEMAALGYNYRLPDLLCALGISQLQRLPQNLARRREIAARYRAAFVELPGLTLPPQNPDVEPAWHLYPIRLDPTALGCDRDQVFRALRAENLGVNVHYIPVHLHPYYCQRFDHHRGEFPIAEAAYDRLISLPMFHGMTDGDVDDVIAAVRKVFCWFAKHHDNPDAAHTSQAAAASLAKSGKDR